MDYTKPPCPVFRKHSQQAHLTASVDCLVSLATNYGDIDDCNKAATDLVEELQRRFDTVVRCVGTLPEFDDLEYAEKDNFVYYAVMERWGHGVGLTDTPGRFPEPAINLARDETTDLYARVEGLVDWIEQNLDDGGEYAIEGRLVIEVSLYTADSVENSESAASVFPIDVGIDAVLDDVVGFAEDCETTDEEVEAESSDPVSLGSFIETLEDVLDGHAVEIGDTSWRVSYGTQELLALQSYRSLPFMRADRGDEESDEDYNRRAEIIGVDVTWWFERGSLTTDHNGPTEQVRWINEHPEHLVEDLVRSTDWYYDKHKAATAAKEVSDG